jgi:nucleoside-diphosphate-sugar epimerase
MADALFVIGASGRTGVALCRRLAAAGRLYVPVVRDGTRWRELGLPGERRVADLADGRSLAATLADARVIVCCAHAGYNPGLLAATHETVRFVLLGGTVRFSRNPDGDGVGVKAGEAAFMGSGRSGLMLHPTFIYGHDTIATLLARLRASSMLTLQGGGKVLIQPVHEDDIAEAIMLAVDRDWPGPRAVVAAGPESLAFRDFLAAVAKAGGIGPPRVVGMPGFLMGALGRGQASAEFHLPAEDQKFSIAGFAELLGRPPIPLAEGLARALS